MNIKTTIYANLIAVSQDGASNHDDNQCLCTASTGVPTSHSKIAIITISHSSQVFVWLRHLFSFAKKPFSFYNSTIVWNHISDDKTDAFLQSVQSNNGYVVVGGTAKSFSLQKKWPRKLLKASER